MTGPLVSVITPVFNGERYLARAIESVFAQDHRPVEAIVVDDGSTDGSAEVARRFDEVIVLEQENEGPAAARNRGVARSSGEFITFLDADDRMAPGRLSAQLEFLAQTAVGCVLMHQEVVLEPGMSLPGWLRPFDAPDDVVGGLMITAMMRRDLFLDSGGFDPSYRLCEDLDLLFRLRDSGVGIEVLPMVGVRRRIHRGNATHDVAGVRAALARAVRERMERSRAARSGGDA
jgi:glycosyltransferase involved in cell wall biosynthesis